MIGPGETTLGNWWRIPWLSTSFRLRRFGFQPFPRSVPRASGSHQLCSEDNGQDTGHRTGPLRTWSTLFTGHQTKSPDVVRSCHRTTGHRTKSPDVVRFCHRTPDNRTPDRTPDRTPYKITGRSSVLSPDTGQGSSNVAQPCYRTPDMDLQT